MSGFITASGENYILNLITTPGSTLASYFIALGRNLPPTRYTSGDQFDEPVGLDYARAPFENASGNWSPRLGSVSNTIAINFPVATSVWGLCQYWAICSTNIGGQILWAGQIPTPVTINIADQCVLPPGTLSFKSPGYVTRVML